jgi:thiazole synthase
MLDRISLRCCKSDGTRADAVLVNTAIAVGNPNLWQKLLEWLLLLDAYEAKLAQQYKHAVASSPLTAFLHQ